MQLSMKKILTKADGPKMQTLIRHTPRPCKHWAKWLMLSHYRQKQQDYRQKQQELARLESLPRYSPTTTDILGEPLEIIDGYSFVLMYRDIFEQQIYRFPTTNPSPYIIDGGANIGISISFFKQMYPNCQIVAFEPEVKVFDALERNIQRVGYGDVELIRRALWSSETSLSFLIEGSDGGRIARNGDQEHKVVRTVRLRDYLDRPVDFLKMDIEGAETEVLADCADLLGNVDNLFVEYHSIASEPQTLDKLITILTDAGFRLQIHQVSRTSTRPFMYTYLKWGMDMQLNIFAMRPSVLEVADMNAPGTLIPRANKYEKLGLLTPIVWLKALMHSYMAVAEGMIEGIQISPLVSGIF